MPQPQSSVRSLASLLVAQCQITFNSSAASLMLLALVQFRGVVTGTDADAHKGLLCALFAAPLVVFAPLAGWVTDRFAKSRVLKLAAAVQVLLLGALAIALWLHQLGFAIAAVALISVAMAVFAPAKRGVLMELVQEEKLSRAVGLMEMLSVFAMLLGAYLGGRMFDHWTMLEGGPWQGAFWTAVALSGCSLVGWAVLLLMRRTRPQSDEPFTAGLFLRHGRQIGELWRARPILRATLGIMFFYGVGSYVNLVCLQIGAAAHQNGVGSASASSGMLLMVGLGAIAGNLIAGLLSRGAVELGFIPVGGAILVLSLTALGLTAHDPTLMFHGWLAAAGFGAGTFLVPLYAFIQREAGDGRRGRVLATVGMLDSLAGLTGSNLFVLAAGAHYLNLRPSTQFILLAVLALAGLAYALRHTAHNAVSLGLRGLSAVFCRVRVQGAENLPAAGGALIICNHVSYIDALILQVALPRRAWFMAFTGGRLPGLSLLALRATGVKVVGPRQARAASKRAVERLREGDLVCVFPEVQISRSGVVMELRDDFIPIARAAKVPVAPVFLDRLWSRMFAFSGQKYFWKQQHHKLPCRVAVLVGGLLPSGKADAIAVRKALYDLGEIAFSERPELLGHLGRECVRSLARRPWETQIVDCTSAPVPLKAGRLLAVSAALSRRIAAKVPGRRVGIVLPPSAGCCVANIAVLLAGKIPVNLNFTAGSAAIESSMRLGEVTTVLTAEAMRQKVLNFPWPEKTLDLREEILGCGRAAIFKWLVASWILPGKLIANLLGLPHEGGREEAGLLFTSGTAGEPKGVPLSHRNILGNCAQISATGILPKDECLLACLPIFHSTGSTVTLWYAMLRGCRIVTLPSPLDARRMAEMIAQEKVTVLIGTPTFLRPLLRKASRGELSSLRFAVSGAEKMPVELYEAFKEQFGLELLQGFGLTETTPVTNINMPAPLEKVRGAEGHRGHRLGSVGRMLPGMTARIVDPDTGAELPLTSSGIVWFRGANVFEGYLRDEQRTRMVLRDGWFATGDLGRFDEDGFLFIEGRLSRFSKIGGEMVPHGTVEQKILEAYQIDEGNGPQIAVIGVPDTTKGEAIVLLTVFEIDADDLRERLFKAGLPNLWIPKIIRRVHHIPLLGSGKTDIRGCQQLAIEAAR